MNHGTIYTGIKMHGIKICTNRPLLLLLFGLMANTAFGNPGSATPGRPNVLIIMTDQQRFDALSYAGNTVLHTPNLDRIASEGAWFKNAYTPCAVCAPARASILTGRNVENHAVTGNGAAYDSKTPGIMTMSTFDEILGDHGYSCAYYGKWHSPIEHARVYQNAVTATKTTDLGPSMKKDYLNFLDPLFPKGDLEDGEFYDTYTLRPYLAHPIDKRYDLASRGEDTSEKPGQSDIHGVTTIPTEFHISAHETGEVLDALERLKDSAFSITCSFHHPHPPFLATEKYTAMFPPAEMPLPPSLDDDMENSPYQFLKEGLSPMYSDPEKIRYFISEYYALVKEIDDRVGTILDKLDELGLAENTLVIFLSDHGEMLGAHGLRSKNIFYEEASHVPLMIRFPGVIAPGTRVESYISTVNIFATIFDYLGMDEPPSDGFSLRGLIEGTDSENGKYVVTEWLSSLSSKPSHMVIKDGWKLMLPDSSATDVIKALYNLNEDPYEMTNLLGNHPNAPAYASKVDELEYCFVEWLMKSRGLPFTPEGASPSFARGTSMLYPNPALDELRIHVDASCLPARIEILDINGRLRKDEILSGEYTCLDVSELPPGLYLHRINGAQSAPGNGKFWIR